MSIKDVCETKKKMMTSSLTTLHCMSAQSQWKTLGAQDKILQWCDLQNQREEMWCEREETHTTRVRANLQWYLLVLAGDRRLTGSCNFHLTHRYWKSHSNPKLTEKHPSCLTHPHFSFFLLNCAWIKIILSWGNAKQTAHLLYPEQQNLPAIGFL